MADVIEIIADLIDLITPKEGRRAGALLSVVLLELFEPEVDLGLDAIGLARDLILDTSHVIVQFVRIGGHDMVLVGAVVTHQETAVFEPNIG